MILKSKCGVENPRGKKMWKRYGFLFKQDEHTIKIVINI